MEATHQYTVLQCVCVCVCVNVCVSLCCQAEGREDAELVECDTHEQKRTAPQDMMCRHGDTDTAYELAMKTSRYNLDKKTRMGLIIPS